MVNQWASHPSNEDRYANLSRLNIHRQISHNHLANSVFQDIVKTQENQTAKIFCTIENVAEFKALSFEIFKKEYPDKFRENTFNPIYNFYYDNYDTKYFEIDTLEKPLVIPPFKTLFDKEKIDMVYDFIALQGDTIVLKKIADKEFKIKSFDYDGHKFKSDKVEELIPKIEKDSDDLMVKILKNDIDIFNYFSDVANKSNQKELLISKYKMFFAYDKTYDNNFKLFSDLQELTHFFSIVTPIQQIKTNLDKVYKLEIEVKEIIREMLVNELYASILTPSIIGNFEMYLKEEWLYFTGDKYINSELEIYYNGINDYSFVLSKVYFSLKKDLLDFQNKLILD